MNNTWEIMYIISSLSKRTRSLRKHSKKRDELEELYAQAIRLQCNSDYGLVLVVDDFIKAVEDGYFTDDDGCGCWLDHYGNRQSAVRCNAKWLKNNRGDYKFIRWFNK